MKRCWVGLGLMLAVVRVTAADEPIAPAPPEVLAVTLQETTLATVVATNAPARRFVADHAEALSVYLRTAAALTTPPGFRARIEILDTLEAEPLRVSVSGGHTLVAVYLGEKELAAERAATAVARTWLAAASVAGAQPQVTPTPWATPALAAETLAQLRPAMVDLWYRRALAGPPTPLAEVVAAQAPIHESLLLVRVLRRQLGAESFARVLAAAGRGESLEPTLASFDKDPETWWLAARQAVLDARPSPSLGMKESLAALDQLARFVHNPEGKGDRVMSGPEAVRWRHLPGVREAMDQRLLTLRREIIRQNPVAHNSWRTLGAWLEAYATGEPERLDRLWAAYLLDRRAAERLASEVETELETAR